MFVLLGLCLLAKFDLFMGLMGCMFLFDFLVIVLFVCAIWVCFVYVWCFWVAACVVYWCFKCYFVGLLGTCSWRTRFGNLVWLLLCYLVVVFLLSFGYVLLCCCFALFWNACFWLSGGWFVCCVLVIV